MYNYVNEKKQLNNIIQKITELSKEDKAAFLDYLLSNLTNNDLNNINNSLSRKFNYTISRLTSPDGLEDNTIYLNEDTIYKQDIIDISTIKNGCIVDVPIYIADDNLILNIKGADYIYYTPNSIKLETPLTRLKHYRLHMIINGTIEDGDLERTVIFDLQELTKKQ